MAQVFLSYQKRDRGLAQKIDSALSRAGLTIWWDDDINPRENWDREIEREIDNAEFVLVLWTNNSIDSDWVRLEAHRAKQFKPSKLIQARFDDCALPIAFLLTQYLDLDRERPDEDPGWQKLLRWLHAPDPFGVETPGQAAESNKRVAKRPHANKPRRRKARIARPVSTTGPPTGEVPHSVGADVNPQYAAFLAYSHKDAAAAARLHRRLEAYRLPRHLVGRITPRGTVPERLRIFRDYEELPAAADLSKTVREALAQSGALITLCSPSSAGSLWVAEEIQTFRHLHTNRPVLAAVLDGDLPDCFPPVLRSFDQDGVWHEPLATDLRRQADGGHLGVLKLVAGITGLGLDELVQRDAARRTRQATAVAAVALAALLVIAALALMALDARRDLERLRTQTGTIAARSSPSG